MLLFVLVKVPPLDKTRGLSNSNTITGALMLWVQLQQRLSGSCPAPRGKGTWEEGDQDNPMQHSIAGAQQGGRNAQGRNSCWDTPTQPPPAKAAGSSSAHSQGCCSHWILKDCGQQGLLWVVFICANKGRTAALGNSVLLQLACGCSPANCPESCPLQSEHDFQPHLQHH